MTVSLATSLRDVALRMREAAQVLSDPAFEATMTSIREACEQFQKAWSGSNLGYHAKVYYTDFQEPAPGDGFSSEWGLLYGSDTWREFSFGQVVRLIEEAAGSPDVSDLKPASAAAWEVVEEAKAEVESILTIAVRDVDDAVLRRFLEETSAIERHGVDHFALQMLPTGQLMTRDPGATGLQVAPHQQVLAEVLAMRSPYYHARELAVIAERAADHLGRLETMSSSPAPTASGTPASPTIFVGHGRSLLWRELKDFLEQTLGLNWVEFNQTSTAGVATVGRLEEMLEQADFAFVLMTAEDELADGSLAARPNVIHEVGLFQGRLGFNKAIVMLEAGCAEFSNIAGLGQIRFAKGNIRSGFEDVRDALRRERLIA